MSMTQTYQTIGEFTVEKREYDFTTGPTYLVRLTGSDDCITSKYCKTDKAVAKLVEKAREIVARKAASKAAAAARHAAKDAAKGVVRDECQICEGGWVIEDGMTSLHGYTRPGHGWLVGSCMGAKQLPFSKSCNLLKAYRQSVIAYQRRVVFEIAALESGDVKEIGRVETRYQGAPTFKHVKVAVKYVKGQAMPVGSDYATRTFADLVKVEIARQQTELRHVQVEIKRVDARLALWQTKFGK